MISHRLFKRFIENEYNFFIQKHTSKMLTRIKSDLDLLTGALTSTYNFYRDCNGNWYQLFDFFLRSKSFLIVSSLLLFFALIYFLLVNAHLREFRQKFEEGRFKNLQEAFGYKRNKNF